MQPRFLASLLAASLLVGLAPAAGADDAVGGTDYFGTPHDSTAVTVRRTRSRTMNQRLLIGGLLAGAVVSIGVGAYFHVDSRDRATRVSANDDLTGETWTPALQATYDRAGTSGQVAMIGYVVGAAFLAGTVIAAWMTRPGEEEIAFRPERKAMLPVIAPVAGGALVGGAWRW